MIRSKMSPLTSEKSFLSWGEKHSKAFWQTERHKSVWEMQEKIVLGILGEKQGSFLGTGRAEMEAFAPEGTKELLSTFRFGALYAGDTLCIVTA